jgi:oligopeptide/dipeptide ABC transporter ATP-binding protein
MESAKSLPILKVQSLCKNFSAGSFKKNYVRVVDSVDMELSAGEIRGIVGESGAGKTTLARCCLRLLEPSSGSIQFDGQDLTGLNPASLRAKRKEFQMIFQDAFASLNPAMTIEQILLEPLQVHKVGDRDYRYRRIRESLQAVSLSESLMNRRPSELSGGQQQRVGIARGLILKPRLVIADEPVSALDASVQAQILNLLAHLKKQFDLTLALISHSLCAIHYLCDTISVLYKGKLIEEAPAAIFFKEPKHPYSRALLDATLVLDPFQRASICSPEMDNALTPCYQPSCSFHRYCAFRLPICARQVPRLTDVRKNERVACFLYSQEPA